MESVNIDQDHHFFCFFVFFLSSLLFSQFCSGLSHLPTSIGYLGLFKMQALLALLGTTYLILNVAFAVSLPGDSSYVAAAGFPTSVFSYDYC